MKVEERSIDSIVPYSRNPRKNSGAVDGVAESIRRFGFKQPLVIDSAGTIVCGHTRYEAAKKLGLRSVPCVLASDLTEDEVRAYRILDNKLAEASYWDFDALRVELGALEEFDFEGFEVDFPSFEVFPGVPSEDPAEDPEPEERPRRERTEDGERIEDGAETELPEDVLPPPFNWVGSKARQRKNILELLSGVKRRGYVEVFGGSAAVLLSKEPEPEEVYNDLNAGVVAFFRALKNKEDAAELRRLCNSTPQSREFYEELRSLARAYIAGDGKGFAAVKERANLGGTSDAVAAAFAFFYVQSFAFGGTLLGTFGYRRGRNPAETYRKKIDLFEDYSRRFDLVLVERLDWRKVLEKYDRPGALFYLDPPYECKSADAYSTGWTTKETEELVSALIALKGQAVLSCYDAPAYRRLRSFGFRSKHFHAFTSVALENAEPDRVETVYFKLDDFETDGSGVGNETETAELDVDSAPESAPASKRKRSKK